MSEPQPVIKPARKLPWYEDPERRQQHLDKMAASRQQSAAVRAEAQEPPPDYEYAEEEPDYPELMRMLRSIRWDRIALSVAEGLISSINQARTEGLARIETRRTREMVRSCDYCHEEFPGGRFTDSRTWTNIETQQIVGRFSCAKILCRNELHKEADAARRRRFE